MLIINIKENYILLIINIILDNDLSFLKELFNLLIR